MRKCSIPRSTSTGQTTSRNAAATTRVPSDTRGATLFEANATAKWPMNNSSPSEHGFLQVGVHRPVAEPDLEQGAVEIFARYRLALRNAVHRDLRPRVGQEIQRDHGLFLRAADLAHE